MKSKNRKIKEDKIIIERIIEMKKNKKGFTLIEIIVVIVILAVLMAVAVPSVLKYINEADSAKYLTLTRAINEEVNIYVAKAIIDGDPNNFDKTIAQLKSDLTYGTHNKIKSIISTKPFNGEVIYSIDCEFDGKNTPKGGWGYDKDLKRHNLTKISVWYNKIGDVGRTGNSKFVVTLLNKQMYSYMNVKSINDALGKEEGPIWGV